MSNGKRNLEEYGDGSDDAFLPDPADNADLAQLAERQASHKQRSERKSQKIHVSPALQRAKRRVSKFS